MSEPKASGRQGTSEPEASGRYSMSLFENAIGEVMTAHDHEAPRAADLLRALSLAPSPASGQRSRTSGQRAAHRYLMPLAAAAAVAAIAVGSAWAGGVFDIQRPSPLIRTARPVKLLHCPARYESVAPWVPALPIHVNGSDRLVPRRAPSSAVMCAYDGTNVDKKQSGWNLSGRRVLTGGLDELAEVLSWQLRASNKQIACTLKGGKQVNYLIGLTYRGGGRIWVAATEDPNSCVGTSNGVFTGFNVGWFAAKAFASGRWPAQPPISCHHGSGGRPGQDETMVPAGSTKLLICAHGGHTLTSGYQSLVSALNALPAFPSTEQCSEAPGPQQLIELYFLYRQGPPVNVSVFRGCSPAINNLSLQATSSRTIWPIVQRLLSHS